MPYSSSLTDKEGEIVEPLLPKKKRTKPPTWSKREILDGVLYQQIMTKSKFLLSPKPSKAQKKKEGKTGFVPVKARWVIERTNSWMQRCKSLVKNFERTLENATTKINLCFVRLMLKRLAAG